MTRSFRVSLRDQILIFEDIIDLSKEQQDHIVKAAQKRTMSEWRNLEEGIKIPLEHWQREEVLAHKNMLVENKDEEKLLQEETIIFTRHAKARLAMRVDKVDPSRPPKPESLLLIIKLVIESDVVDEDAEWKGHANLVYTLIHNEYRERFRISISFEKIYDENIKVITVSNQHIDELTKKLGDKPEIRAELEALMQRLTQQQKSKEPE